jgi:D-arabinose 1-dehydrogenase-like Zn-dependent alcohol dehydrogenase
MEFLLDLLPYVAIAVIFYNIGSHTRAFQIMQNLANRPDDFIEMINKIKDINGAIEVGMPEDAIEVKTEQVNDLVFAYNKVTGEFLAQAQNLHQVMTLAAARYPGKKFWHPELKQDSQTA